MAAKVATMLALVLGLARAPPLLRRPGGRAELRLRGELYGYCGLGGDYCGMGCQSGPCYNSNVNGVGGGRKAGVGAMENNNLNN
uniref:Uncharacterized protein n=1 Tax=Oryza nivara TaxID=4536 RepID=A0A0E0GYJ1_ORYNI